MASPLSLSPRRIKKEEETKREREKETQKRRPPVGWGSPIENGTRRGGREKNSVYTILVVGRVSSFPQQRGKKRLNLFAFFPLTRPKTDSQLGHRKITRMTSFFDLLFFFFFLS